MAVKVFKPTSPGRRFQTVSAFEDITTDKPEKSLLVPLKRTGGRNCYGRITARYIGGGHKRMYRIIDFKRDKRDIPATVATIEYDPNRSSRIALLHYRDGEKRYILAPLNLKAGDVIMAGEEAEFKTGNALPIRKIPIGTLIHNVELKQGKGGQVVRGQVLLRKSWQKREPMHISGCLREKYGWCIMNAMQPLARLVTLIMKTSPLAKLAATAGRAESRGCAAWP